MELSDLTAYAGEKYRIQEEHKWTEFPGFSVLCHPQTGKWVALLMRQRETDSGTEIQRCDLKCGNGEQFGQPYLTAPFRMHGENWLGIRFDERTEPQIVFELLDRAIALENPHGATIVLEAKNSPRETDYQETALPFSDSSGHSARERPPEKIREMRHLFAYKWETMKDKADNFYRQAVFMEAYEDDFPWPGEDFACPSPTYRDLTTKQLRGYFTWRTEARRGHFLPIPASAATIYVYELLNGVGADSPEDVVEKLRAFITGYLDSGIGDPKMRKQVYRWILEYGVLWDVSPEILRKCIDPEMIALDADAAVLREPEVHSAEEIFSALCRVGDKKIAESPVIRLYPSRGRELFSRVWQSSDSTHNDRKLCEFFFGKKGRQIPWNPLSTAVYVHIKQPKNRKYVLNNCRSFEYADRFRSWEMNEYWLSPDKRYLLKRFLHETDARLRRYLKTGRYLKENPKDAWVSPFIDAVLESDREAVMEAQRQKVAIDFSGLEQIRRDAGVTRDSLLTEEERDDLDERVPLQSVERAAPAIPLDDLQREIIRGLLRGEEVTGLLRASHRLPSMTADAINEALLEEVGDTVIACENDHLTLVEDYIEDLVRILGGTENG